MKSIAQKAVSHIADEGRVEIDLQLASIAVFVSSIGHFQVPASQT